MLGGKLNSKSIYASESRNLVLLAFSNSFYTFSKDSGVVLNKFTFHQSNVLHFAYSEERDSLISIDQNGTLIVSSFLQTDLAKGIQMKLEKQQALCKGKDIRLKAATIDLGNSPKVYYLTEDNDLSVYTESNRKSKSIGHYFGIGGVFENRLVLFTKENRQQLVVLDSDNFNVLFTHESKFPIRSVTSSRGNSLVIGDQKGKIYIFEGVLNSGKVTKKLKLQWHLHSVLSLCASGNYLYSGGQQGTVVLWHFKENTKDFLPRIGTSINSISVHNAEITCFLSDNTVRIIDLNQDKKVTQYRLLVDPDGFVTKKLLSKRKVGGKFGNVQFNGIQECLCLNSLPGKLQFFNVRSAFCEEVGIFKRNYISRLDDSYPNPHQIVATTFNQNWKEMMVAIEGENHSSLNFYRYGAVREGQCQWSLLSKILNPHSSKIEQSLFLSGKGDSKQTIGSESEGKFLTYSLQDPNIKLWSLKRQRRKSVLEIDEEFWNCDFEINYRNRLPLHVSVSNVNGLEIAVSYDNEVVLFDINEKKIVQQYRIKGVRKFFVLDVATKMYQIQNRVCIEKENMKKKKEKYSAKNNITSIQFPCEDIIFYPNLTHQKIALECINQQADSLEITVYNISNNELEQRFEITQSQKSHKIECTFWVRDRLIAITNDLLFFDLTHNEQLFVQSNKKRQQEQSSMEQESADTRDIVAEIEAAEERWVSKEAKKKTNIGEDILGNMTLTPSFVTGFKLMSDNALL